MLPWAGGDRRGTIRASIQAVGGYVNIPPLRSGPGIDILFSPGMPVVWAQIEVGSGEDDSDDSADAELDVDQFGTL